MTAQTEGQTDLTVEQRIEALKKVHDFADLPDEQVRWFAENTTEMRLATGDIFFRKGDSPEFMLVLLEGETHAQRSENGFDGFIYIARAGDPATEITGKLPFSRMQRLEATSRAVAPTRVLLFPVRLFPEMMTRMPALVERLVWKMSDRVRETTRMDEQRDKLMALGKLSAGLAHELNNPAAAARRAANELLAALEKLREADLNLCRHDLSNEQRAFLSGFEREQIESAGDSAPLSALERSDREDTLGELLDARGVEDAWCLAPVLADAGLGADKLESLRAQVGDGALGDALGRVSAQLAVARLVHDIGASAGRISELVGAIKEYTYMDRARVQHVDVHKALENTLLILKHKLKKKNAEIVRDYDSDLPAITAWGSELNQMWTNLIDNAADALPETGGRLQIKTKREPSAVLIEIRDNGAGIPPEVQPHIFEPFFTTKAVGDGTGLGLDTVARIVRQHHGFVRFESKPGDTCFQVRLPLEQKSA